MMIQLKGQTIVLQFSDDIVTVQLHSSNNDAKEGEDKKHQQKEHVTKWIYMNIGGSSDDDDDDNDNDDIPTMCDDVTSNETSNEEKCRRDADDIFSDLDSISSTSSSESESSSDEESEEEEEEEVVDMNRIDQVTSSIRKLDASISLRGLLILCLYSVAHGSLYECVATILEATTPSLNLKYMVLCGILILRVTGGLEWYVDFMDDEDGRMYEKVKKMRRQRKTLMRYLSRDGFLSSLTASKMSWENTARKQRLQMMQRGNKTQKFFKRFRMVTLLLELFGFYLIYMSCTSVVTSVLVDPWIDTPKFNLLKDLPSSKLNITNSYHPSLINRYLTAALQYDWAERNAPIDDKFIEIVQDEIMKKTRKAISNNTKWCSGESMDYESSDNTCHQENHEMFTFNSDDSIHLHFEHTSSHIMAIRDLEEKWTIIDDEYIREVTSPWAYTSFFGSNDTRFTSCPKYFLLNASIFIATLYLLQKVGVSAGNILG